MQDLLWEIKNTDAFVFAMAGVFTAAVFWFIREIVEAPTLAIGSIPVLLASGVVSPMLFRSAMVNLAYDKDTNIAAMVAVGVAAALVLIIAVKWLWTIIVERQVRKARLQPLATGGRARR